ncbi:AMP-binding protein [Bradyrhizobium sp. 200]|uniref:AMP-binding protein n=1 Tax=Bradyrhizobium sp. 200 TaxID=2782665 RepID=UPI001FFF35A1|nr:AMP-binding protein [Bradyrhizobium sp. 200]UPJ48415.1 AMP-binding protein [Bradyrhizobium sp. 200]
MSIVRFFDAGARAHSSSVCLQGPAGDVWTYSEALSKTVRIARGLIARGFSKGFHGAVLSGNKAEALIAILGVCRAEGVWLPVNARNTWQTNAEFLKDMDCDVLFFESRWKEDVQRIRAQVTNIRLFVCLEELDRELSLRGLMASQPDGFFTPDWDPEGTAMIMATGGTTGRSKGAMLTNRNFSNTFASHMSVFNIAQRMTMLVAAPISHTAGAISLPFLARGARLVMMDGIEPQKLLQKIQDEKVNILFLPPTVIYVLLAQPNVREFDYSSLKYLLYGAAPMSPDKLVEAIEVFGPVMTQMYGQSEVPGAISALSADEHLVDGKPAPRARLLSAGRPFPFVRVEILCDDDCIAFAPGVRGEIIVQGDTVMKGYYKNPDATAQSRWGPWHRTGDIGELDENGYLTIVDRKKDMIITGGFNVYSTEVEAALMSHTAVKDCAVIGIPDEKWGEAVKAIVELRPGAPVEADSLREFARERLGGVKAPKSVEIVDSLPRSAAGKVLKKDLRRKYWTGLERSV